MKNLRALRIKGKMSQTELSKRAGVSRTIISGLESGKITVTTTGTLNKLAKALNTDVSNFFEKRV